MPEVWRTGKINGKPMLKKRHSTMNKQSEQQNSAMLSNSRKRKRQKKRRKRNTRISTY